MILLTIARQTGDIATAVRTATTAAATAPSVERANTITRATTAVRMTAGLITESADRTWAGRTVSDEDRARLAQLAYHAGAASRAMESAAHEAWLHLEGFEKGAPNEAHAQSLDAHLAHARRHVDALTAAVAS